MVNKDVLKPKCRLCYVATNKQKTFPWREGGKEGGEAGKEGEGRRRGFGGLNGYAFPVIIQFWDVESRFAFAILLFNVLKESFVWAECFELRYVYVSLTTVFESNYKPCKGW